MFNQTFKLQIVQFLVTYMNSKYLWNLNVKFVETLKGRNLKSLVILYFHLLILFITSNYLVERGC